MKVRRRRGACSTCGYALHKMKRCESWRNTNPRVRCAMWRDAEEWTNKHIHKRRWVIKKAYFQTYDDDASLTIDQIEERIRYQEPDYGNDHLANIPEIIQVRITIEEIKSLGKAKCLNLKSQT